MRQIYTGIDIGSDSIKIVVSEFINNKFYILASASKKTKGIKKGLIINPQELIETLREALSEIEKSIGVKINEAIITIPSNERILEIVSSSVVIGEKEVSGNDIVNVLYKAAIDNKKENYELVSIMPIVFNIDGNGNYRDPKGQKGKELEAKAVIASIPSKIVYEFLKVFVECNVEVSDIVISGIADYFELKSDNTKGTLGAIINVGSETTDISIFNKGILIKNSIINLGSKNIDKDIAYIYNLELDVSKELKEKFAVCSRRYADANDLIEAKSKEKENTTINQYEITEIVESRVNEILNLAKKEINDLTKRKLSYIIITGGISDLVGFSYIVENIFGINASTHLNSTIGIRSNKYSTSMGMIKYFHEKMELRNKKNSLLNEEKINEMMINKRSIIELSEDTLIGKIFGSFIND